MKKGEKIFFLGIIIYSFAIIYASEQFAFINQGDFSRTTGKFLSSNVQFLLEWPLLENPSMPHPWEVYSVFLWLISKISKLFTNTFVLAISSVVQKIILLFIVYSLLFTEAFDFFKNNFCFWIYRFRCYFIGTT